MDENAYEAPPANDQTPITNASATEEPRYRHLSILRLLGIMALFAAAWTIANFETSFVLVGWYTVVQFCPTRRARLLAVAVPFFLWRLPVAWS